MQKNLSIESKEKVLKVLEFFNIAHSDFVFNSDFDIYLVKINKNNLFNYEFAQSLEIILQTILNNEVFLKVDYNNSFTNLLNSIKDELNTIVNQAKYYNKPVAVQSKNAFERRLKHFYIDNTFKVRHESIGEGLNRQIIIYPN